MARPLRFALRFDPDHWEMAPESEAPWEAAEPGFYKVCPLPFPSVDCLGKINGIISSTMVQDGVTIRGTLGGHRARLPHGLSFAVPGVIAWGI